MRVTLAKLLFALTLTTLPLACQDKSAPAANTRGPTGAVAPEPTGDPAGGQLAGSGTAANRAQPDPTAPVTSSPRPHRKDEKAALAVGASGSMGRARPGQLAGDLDRPEGGDGFRDYGQNAWVDTSRDALSTFAVDVDTAAYTISRRMLTEGALPPAAAVRVEEMVNYFKYAYPAPDRDDRPFSLTVDAAPSPMGKDRHVVRVGVATRAKSKTERKPVNLVFLVDVSGSMQGPDRLDLAKRSLRLLVDSLNDGDQVSLVTYAGSTRVVLEPTTLADKGRILAAIEDLTAGGSTAMASGIELAYQQAARGLRPGSESRVIILSDGDANVGPTGQDEILTTIAGKVKEGVTLSTMGFGMGNYKDERMEQLANRGNGNNFYIDGLSQAKRVFQEQLGSNLEVVAKDVKLQVDFDPSRVARYRLIGYENRDLADDAFRDDKVDAGEIGAGHQVTAVYEVELTAAGRSARAGALATVRVRHKAPRGEQASEHAFTLDAGAVAPSFAAASPDLRFAFAVAGFADVLRGGADARTWTLPALRELAAAAAGDDADRRELVGLIDRAITLRGGTKVTLAQ
ncbi:MAG: VWA domain-containing protein [Kofleriaceae bacterium]|jgi:Ca-activated chloride channel family protein|nr:VWA domain-containing protein [Kofleriaceae bacterium]MBP9204960.1 VWA domain-containing protein [Kofleriaceae bacterium]